MCRIFLFKFEKTTDEAILLAKILVKAVKSLRWPSHQVEDIHETLENAIDRCEDVANLLEGIALKNS